MWPSSSARRRCRVRIASSGTYRFADFAPQISAELEPTSSALYTMQTLNALVFLGLLACAMATFVYYDYDHVAAPAVVDHVAPVVSHAVSPVVGHGVAPVVDYGYGHGYGLGGYHYGLPYYHLKK
ncbi:uncharacterized protein LOC135392146 [Ornithodoros turicata]|uniref:uncharacterized protein LOC135392146 n=1 Tax=Ornithodoros turicata TaxID=34597 RepID=UPI00313A1940